MTNTPDDAGVRFIGGIPSNLVLLDETRQEKPAFGVRYACWTRSVSSYAALVATTAQLRRGQPVLLQLAEIGSVRGHVQRHVEGGVTIRFELNETDRSLLAGKIAWHRKRVLFSTPDRREYKRRAPADPNSTLLLADGATMPCKIIDVSRSGAAVTASIQPEIGAPLALGQVVGRVVRHIDKSGFAMQFLSVQDEDKLDQMVHPARAPDRDA